MPKTIIKIDYSTLSAYKRCPRYFFNAYFKGLTLAQSSSDALQFGELFHFGLELLHQESTCNPVGLESEVEYLMDGNPPREGATGVFGVFNEVADCASKTSLATLPKNSKRSVAHLLLLLLRYSQHYLPEPIVKFKAHETSLSSMLYENAILKIIYCGTLDGVLEDNTIFETKTAAWLGSNFLDRMEPNAQVDGYIWLKTQALGGSIEETRVLFNAISTSGYGALGANSRPASWTINRDPAKLFLRSETSRTVQQINTWQAETIKQTIALARDITLYKTLNILPSQGDTPTCCTQYNSTCQFKQLCTVSPEIAANLEQQNFIVKPWKNFSLTEE